MDTLTPILLGLPIFPPMPNDCTVTLDPQEIPYVLSRSRITVGRLTPRSSAACWVVSVCVWGHTVTSRPFAIASATCVKASKISFGTAIRRPELSSITRWVMVEPSPAVRIASRKLTMSLMRGPSSPGKYVSCRITSLLIARFYLRMNHMNVRFVHLRSHLDVKTWLATTVADRTCRSIHWRRLPESQSRAHSQRVTSDTDFGRSVGGPAPKKYPFGRLWAFHAGH